MLKHKYIKTTMTEFINEVYLKGLILYRGVDNANIYPNDNEYSFFAENKSFAEDYGDYIWKCTFSPLNIFTSYKSEGIHELYNNGFKLRDYYIEDNWDTLVDSGDVVIGLYDYSSDMEIDDMGYKSAEDTMKSPYIGSDTWEMIEKTDGVLDYILSKYDGILLLEGGEKTYYIRTDKIVDYFLL